MRFKFMCAALAAFGLPVAGYALADATYVQPASNGKLFSFEENGALRFGVFRGAGDRQAELDGWERETIVFAEQICSSYRPTLQSGLFGQRLICEWNADEHSKLMHVWIADEAPPGMLETLRICSAAPSIFDRKDP